MPPTLVPALAAPATSSPAFAAFALSPALPAATSSPALADATSSPAFVVASAPSPLGQLPGPLPTANAVLLAVGLVLAVALATGAAVRWRARRYYLDPESDAETALHIRRLRRYGLLGGWLLAVLVTTRFGVATAVRLALADVVPDTLGAVLAVVVVGVLPMVPVALAVRLATVPYRRAVRGLRLRYRDAAAWELQRDGVGVVGVLVATAAIASVPGGWPRVLTALGLGFVATALTPFALVVALRTRWPTDAERAALDDVLGDARLRVVDDRTRVGSALAAGVLPGARYVFVTESLFDVLDERELRAVAAHEVGHHAHNHVALRFSLVALAAGAVLGVADVLPAQVTLVALAVGALPFAVGLAWVVRGTEREADAYAVETVGGEALASALETLAERRYVFDSPERFRALSYHPPLAERITGLRGSGGVGG